MTNLIVLIMFALLLFGLSYLCKDILTPPVLLTVAWMLPFLWLVISEGVGQGGFDIDILAIFYVVGVLVFCSGYFFVNRKAYTTVSGFKISDKKQMTVFFKIFIIIELLITIYFVYDVYKFIIANFQYNFWFTYKWNVSMGNYQDFFVIPYLRTASRVLVCVMFVQFLQEGHNKKDTKWFFLQLALTIVLNVLGKGRGGIFGFVIPLGIIFILIRRKNNADVIKYGLGLIGILMIVFVVISKLKSPYESAKSIPITKTIENYLCGSVVAFCNWMKEGNHDYAFGQYTFRFFLALLNGLGLNVNVVSMAEPYVTNLNDNVGNVYTFYKWYANDFGLIYALFWQFIVGVVHGYITKKAFTLCTEKWLIWYAITIYPLVMQFFMDEYITMLSSWIQIFFIIYIVFNTKLFYIPYESKTIPKRIKRVHFSILR